MIQCLETSVFTELQVRPGQAAKNPVSIAFIQVDGTGLHIALGKKNHNVFFLFEFTH